MPDFMLQMSTAVESYNLDRFMSAAVEQVNEECSAFCYLATALEADMQQGPAEDSPFEEKKPADTRMAKFVQFAKELPKKIFDGVKKVFGIIMDKLRGAYRFITGTLGSEVNVTPEFLQAYEQIINDMEGCTNEIEAITQLASKAEALVVKATNSKEMLDPMEPMRTDMNKHLDVLKKLKESMGEHDRFSGAEGVAAYQKTVNRRTATARFDVKKCSAAYSKFVQRWGNATQSILRSVANMQRVLGAQHFQNASNAQRCQKSIQVLNKLHGIIMTESRCAVQCNALILQYSRTAAGAWRKGDNALFKGGVNTQEFGPAAPKKKFQLPKPGQKKTAQPEQQPQDEENEKNA